MAEKVGPSLLQVLLLKREALNAKDRENEASLPPHLPFLASEHLPDNLMNLAKSLKIESVSRLNPSPPLQMSPEQTVAEAVSILRQEQVGCLLVCEQNRLVGIVTERDVMRRILAQGKPLTLPLSQCMTPDPVVVDPKESISSAIQRMEAGGYRHLPVVDKTGYPLGVLSVKKIVHYLVEHFPGTVYNLPPDSNVVHNNREGA
jgi:CBS domain-containing protein